MEEQKSNTFDKDRTSFGTDGSVNEYCIDKSEIQNIVDKNGEESAKPLDFIMDEERETEKESNPKFGLALEKIEQHIEEQAESYKKMAADVREMHKLYHNEFAGRLKSMQDELECYHEIDRGRAFDDVLREVARIYCDNEALLNVEVDDKTAKHIKYLLWI